METIYALIVVFTSWDDCQKFAHTQAKAVDVYVQCETVKRESSLAPRVSLRPKARPGTRAARKRSE